MAADGWLNAAERFSSPNCDDRPAGVLIELVVIHGISLPPGAFGAVDTVSLFTNRLSPEHHPDYPALAELRVSAHFLVSREGRLLQFVSCAQRAWHAGVSSWQGRRGCNDFSIGIEFEGTDNLPYEVVQYEVCAALISALAQAYPLNAVVGHSDISPGRKTDPGPCLDWSQVPLHRSA